MLLCKIRRALAGNIANGRSREPAISGGPASRVQAEMLEIRARNRASDLDQCSNLQSFDLPGREAHWRGCSSDNIGNIDRQWMAVDRAPFMPWRIRRSRVWARELRLNARLLRQNTDDGEADIVADLPIAAATRCRNEEGATIGSCFTCRLTNREALVD